VGALRKREQSFFQTPNPAARCVGFAFRGQSLYVHLTMSELNNGESPSLPLHRKPKRHTAKHCPFSIRERIVNALANGDSKRSIARALQVSIHTINAVAEQEWQRVAARKAKLAARYEKLADLYTERQIDELESGAKIPLNLCQSGGGIATDKAMALRGDPSLIIQQKVDLQNQSRDMELIQGLYDLIASIGARIKTMPVEVPPLPKPVDCTNPIMTGCVNAMNFALWLSNFTPEPRAMAAKALPPGDPCSAGETAAQKET
jgi:hypothetical protein